MKEQPWHAQALRMQAEGATWNEIARAVDRSLTTIGKLFSPTYAQQQYALTARRQKERRKTDPEFRARRLASWRAWYARQREKRRG